MRRQYLDEFYGLNDESILVESRRMQDEERKTNHPRKKRRGNDNVEIIDLDLNLDPESPEYSKNKEFEKKHPLAWVLYAHYTQLYDNPETEKIMEEMEAFFPFPDDVTVEDLLEKFEEIYARIGG